MRAEIVSIGTELLLGTITDTNASFLAQRLASLGIDCYYVSQVGDNLDRLLEVLRRAWERSDLTVATGGLGPTQDDLTREAIASLLGETPSVDPKLETELRAFFSRRGYAMPESNVKQATLIPSAQFLDNPVGTAPGWWVERPTPLGTRYIAAMPGVPFEMKRMWAKEVEPKLLPMTSGVIRSRTLKVLGMGESLVEERVADLMGGSNPTLAPYAKRDGIHLRITAKAGTEDEAAQLIQQLELDVRARLGDAVYGNDEETPASAVLRLLDQRGSTWAVLEVGASVAGVLHEAFRGGGLTTALSVSSLAEFATILGEVREPVRLSDAARTLNTRLKSGLVVALSGQVEQTVNDEVVLATIEVQIVADEGAGDFTHGEVTQHWRTSRSEVSRLAGLAALDAAKKYLTAG